MKRSTFLVLALSAILAGSHCVSAQDQGAWRASDSNAKAITGDIFLTGSKVTIDFSTFTLAQIRNLTQAELSAAFDADPDGSTGFLYRLSIPAQKRFAHHNTLCGTEDTQWMATYTQGHNLRISFFSGANMPVLTIDALANTTDRCGTFAYVR